MKSCCQRHLPPLVLLLCLARSSPAGEFTDHRVQIKIDRRATIVTPASPLKLKRAMLGMQLREHFFNERSWIPLPPHPGSAPRPDPRFTL